jgi:hypothetical protein
MKLWQLPGQRSRSFQFFLDLLREKEPKLLHAPAASGRRVILDSRERIGLREIHQMNCFNDDLCLLLMGPWARNFPNGVKIERRCASTKPSSHARSFLA